MRNERLERCISEGAVEEAFLYSSSQIVIAPAYPEGTGDS